MAGAEKMGQLLSQMKLNKKQTVICWRILFTVLIALLSLTMVTPFLWMISASMKRAIDVMELPIRWMPRYFYPENYLKVWNIGHAGPQSYHFGLAYLNSIKIAVINLIGAVISSTLAGYAFAKLEFKGKQGIFLIYLSTMMIPSQVTLIPKFAIFNKLGLIGTHLPLILPGMITITGTFLMRQYFMQIPNELRESAIVDGASEFRVWKDIMVPIAKPSMASLAMIVFLWNWNAYLEPLVFLSDWRLYTIPLALTNFTEESTTEYNLVMAAASSALIPAFVIFLAGQKFLIKGIVAGAVKG